MENDNLLDEIKNNKIQIGLALIGIGIGTIIKWFQTIVQSGWFVSVISAIVLLVCLCVIQYSGEKNIRLTYYFL
jgi:sensor histidine kinase regulating citrate/malate metabolism